MTAGNFPFPIKLPSLPYWRRNILSKTLSSILLTMNGYYTNIFLSATLLSFLFTSVCGQLTQEEKEAIVSAHNSFRSVVDPIATNMEMMVWNDELARVAQTYSEMCIDEHNNDRVTQQNTFTSVGENLGRNPGSSGSASLYTQLVALWYDEGANFVFEANTCSAVCGHYTQVVWATSRNVGCGVTMCDPLQGGPNATKVFLVCNYGPAGNFDGRQPYITGNDSCSACPDDAPYCYNNLCTPNGPPTTSAVETTTNSAAMTSTSTLLVFMATLCAVLAKLVV